MLAKQEKPQFWKRKPSIVKCNMLLLAHLSRAPVPPIFANDMKYVLKKVRYRAQGVCQHIPQE